MDNDFDRSEYINRRFKDLIASATGINKLTLSIIELVLDIRVQKTIAGMKVGRIEISIHDGVAKRIKPTVEFAVGHEIPRK